MLKREQPLIREGKEVTWHRTGKVLACHLEPEETAQGWERTFNELVDQGFVGAEDAPWLVSNGNQGLLSAAEMCLRFSPRQRCTWHIAHRAREKVSEQNKEAFERDAHWVFKAQWLGEAHRRLRRFAERWRDEEREAVNSVLRKFDQGIEYLRHPEVSLAPRTVAISERYNQEPKRRFRAMRSFGSERNMQALVRLIALRHNCIQYRNDWLAHAARSVWNVPITSVPPQQQQSTHRP